MKKISLLTIFLFIVLGIRGEVSLPPIFANDMVLQQKSNVAIWGKAIPNEKISIHVSWSKLEYSVKASEDSVWMIKIETPEASYIPQNLILKASNTIEIKNVLIGEVWYCGGQSNMEQPVKGYANQPVENSLMDILNSTNNHLRCFTVSRISSVKKLDFARGKWEIANPNTTGNFSATGYYFGRMLQHILNVPVGLLHCSWGGSWIEAWMSPQALSSFTGKKIPESEADNTIENTTPTVLYNGMLSGLIGYGMRGAIWYQGEANRMNYQEYPDLFASMHKDWIEKWNIGDFPIYFCQIAPFNYWGGETAPKYFGALLREAQVKIADRQPLTGMAVLLDAGEKDCIHPAAKNKAGERLALLALGKTYGYNKMQYKSPVFKNMIIKDGKLRLFFEDAPDGLSSFQKELDGFKVSGRDKVFYEARAQIVREKNLNFVELTCPQVNEPIAARYGFTDWFEGCLFGINGLPVSSFRTDNWDEIK